MHEPNPIQNDAPNYSEHEGRIPLDVATLPPDLISNKEDSIAEERLITEVSVATDILIEENIVTLEDLPFVNPDTPPGDFSLTTHLSNPEDSSEAAQTIDLLIASSVANLGSQGTILELLSGLELNHGDTPYSENHISSAQFNSHAPSGDLIFLDSFEFAKKDKPNNGNGNGNGNNGGDDGSDDGGSINIYDTYTSGDDAVLDSNEFNILIDFKGTWTESLQGAFIWASEWISDVIIADIPDVFFRGRIIDDIKITAELVPIDGEFGVLGRAGPTAIRTDGKLPALGIMEFDSADAAYYESIGLWKDIVVHEMLHTIGFGTVWDNLGLISGLGTSSPTFNGTESILAYADIFSGIGEVPLEYGEGSGTDYSHWDDDLFDDEIMTGFISSSNQVTGLTIASLEDLGYETVDWQTFTEFTV